MFCASSSVPSVRLRAATRPFMILRFQSRRDDDEHPHQARIFLCQRNENFIACFQTEFRLSVHAAPHILVRKELCILSNIYQVRKRKRIHIITLFVTITFADPPCIDSRMLVEYGEVFTIDRWFVVSGCKNDGLTTTPSPLTPHLLHHVSNNILCACRQPGRYCAANVGQWICIVITIDILILETLFVVFASLLDLKT